LNRHQLQPVGRILGMNVPSFKLRPDEIHCDFVRSSGPGGQNVNKVATAVQLRFSVRDTQSLSPEIRDRLIRMAGKRVNAAGELVIEARRFRTQQRNREDAMERLLQMIEKALIRRRYGISPGQPRPRMPGACRRRSAGPVSKGCERVHPMMSSHRMDAWGSCRHLIENCWVKNGSISRGTNDEHLGCAAESEAEYKCTS